MRDHGGDIDRAARHYGGTDWIDLSTGINRNPWPVPALSAAAYCDLPTASAFQRMKSVAAAWFRCAPDQVLPLAGASAAIQLLPRVIPRGKAAILSPTYNEHAASLRSAGWTVTAPTEVDGLAGADVAVIVNPNNPDGRTWTPADIATIAAGVGTLIVDESFADPRPDLSVAGTRPNNVVVLRSFGKFWGLAGLRLGFAVAAPTMLARLQEEAGPWSVSGPALEIGTAAMADREWAIDMTMILAEGAAHLDQTMTAAGFDLVGGSHLFRLYDVGDAKGLQDKLARAGIWTRIFPYAPSWMRLGIPANIVEFDRLRAALR